MLLARTKLNTIEVLILKAIIISDINHGKPVLVNNVLREYNEMKEEIKNNEIYYIKTMEIYCFSCMKNTANK